MGSEAFDNQTLFNLSHFELRETNGSDTSFINAVKIYCLTRNSIIMQFYHLLELTLNHKDSGCLAACPICPYMPK